MTPELDALLAKLGSDITLKIDVGEKQAWPGFYLKRKRWHKADVGLQWAKRKTLLGASSAPYLGVRSDRTAPVGATLRTDAECQNRRLDRKDKSNPWWAALNTLPPQGPFPECADDYRAQLRDQLEAVWTAYAPTIDRACEANQQVATVTGT